jgi:hypothetical protein
MNGICCFCGHRDIYENIDNQLRTEIGNAINNGIKTFYSGGMGMFDSKCENIVREYKRGNKDISLILVSPYFIQKFNTEKEWYKTRYDDIIIPDLGNVHYKQAITKRNQWLAEQSDLIIAYVVRKYGGAFTMYKYALKRQINVVNLGKTEL